MSADNAKHDHDLNAETVSAIANLARLSLDDSQCVDYAQSLNKILEMMDTMKGIDTDGIEPLKSPFDHPQPLRDDIVSESNQRAQYQAVAPETQDGLYVVPRVIE
ncbi:aspartyl/glutamyl-tRNA(Asn/Gln) amidotransferase subunit C [Acinetobacter marinus]|uniref:Aspartyl/glutamyl-tRNA(Asn/Gln) amidotransferase subunit C n=1 Tax=Acinetobacter marinus TaxID=281375 RepID=A0A1G6HLU4_9GAMM|nr:Asp-tRNA(Asn)/Glu-tRNA(Gln) amidotransferase subunit GatC [Acinetobacter marinus]SDB95123.1 aspartyl/glutamyl-tRNA(Asn/Gln) amidotransferase subunit C [Acinetobacter marinus]